MCTVILASAMSLASLAGYRILGSKSFSSDLWIDFSHHRVTCDIWYPSDCHPSVGVTHINHFPALIPPLFFPTHRFSFAHSHLCLLLHVLWIKMTLPTPHSFRALGWLKPVITVHSCKLLHWSRCGDMSVWFFFVLTALGLHCPARAFSSCSEWGLLSSCGVWVSHYSGFSSCTASLAVVHRLSCAMACGNLPGPGIKPMSPALAGRFLTTGPPGKSGSICIKEVC